MSQNPEKTDSKRFILTSQPRPIELTRSQFRIQAQDKKNPDTMYTTVFDGIDSAQWFSELIEYAEVYANQKHNSGLRRVIIETGDGLVFHRVVKSTETGEVIEWRAKAADNTTLVWFNNHQESTGKSVWGLRKEKPHEG